MTAVARRQGAAPTATPVPRVHARQATAHRAPRSLRTGFLAATMAVTGIGVGQVAHAPQAHAAQQDIIQPSQAKQTADKQRLMDIINQYRAQRGLAPVKVSAQLSGIVQEHSRTLMAQESIWHSTAFLNDSRAGRYNHANEVIALSYQDDVQQLLDWWKTSPAHNAALLNPQAQVIGIGLVYSDGSLSNTGAPWKILSTINLYGYPAGAAPTDASTRVGGQSAAPVVASSAPRVVYGIAAGYYRGGGAAVYGQPLANEQAPLAQGGARQEFSRGWTLTWSRTAGTHAVNKASAIGAAWNRSGGQNGYGYATTDETRTRTPGGSVQTFQNGAHSTKLVSSPQGGTQAMVNHGAINWYWGWKGGDQVFGFPTSGEYRVGQEMRQNFSNGTVLAWDSVTGHVREIH